MIRKEDALEYHSMGRKGKIAVTPTKPLLTQRDLGLAYTPGVAEPCLEIASDPSQVFEYTARGNLVAVVSNGTAVLGLGNIGALAGKPVMEGKGVLFKRFADIDVFDIEIASEDPDEIINIVEKLEPTFGGINLEDIKAPECFHIEAELKKRMKIPVFHDDQHGTAIISGAALLNALEITKRKVESVKLVVSGAGASAIACANFYVQLGVRLENVLLVDTKGVVYEGRKQGMNPYKARFARPTNCRTLADAMKGADIFLGCSVAGLVTPEMVRSMADRPIVFALANPDPEISYPDAKAARDDVLMATGRSDYPNQVNNVLGFPFIFRGALDSRSIAINEEMKVAASKALAALAKEEVTEDVTKAYGGVSLRFGADYIIPKPFDKRVLWWEASAVAQAAMETGAAGVKLDLEEYRDRLRRMISQTHTVMYQIVRHAKEVAKRKRIVFPEGDSPRILRACRMVLDEGIAQPVLLGPKHVIAERASEYHLDLSRVEVVNPVESPDLERYCEELVKLRQRRGVTPQLSRKIMSRRNPYGMMMVHLGEADGVVSGLNMSYPETIRPALQIIGIRPDVKRAAGMYMMVKPGDEVRFFADATVNLDPDEEALAEIAIQCADAVRELGITPRVAMLSFSNFGSVSHPEAGRAARAVDLVRARRPDIEIDGEMQADTAVNRARFGAMFPFCRLTDSANVLIFPNLAAGNVAYKLVAELGGAEAVGPILLGLRRPVTVLQHESTVDQIVNMTAFTAVTATGGFDRAAAAAAHLRVPAKR